jgi:hypothetical protein
VSDEKRLSWLLFLALVIFGMGCFAPPPRLLSVVLGFAAGITVTYVIDEHFAARATQSASQASKGETKQ